jgi:hypothetical protein
MFATGSRVIFVSLFWGIPISPERLRGGLLNGRRAHKEAAVPPSRDGGLPGLRRPPSYPLTRRAGAYSTGYFVIEPLTRVLPLTRKTLQVEPAGTVFRYTVMIACGTFP